LTKEKFTIQEGLGPAFIGARAITPPHLSPGDLRRVTLTILHQMTHKWEIVEVHRKVQQPAQRQ